MKLRLILAALLAGTALFAQEAEQGRRIEAGPSYLSPLQRRDSIMVWDQLHYGIELKDIKEGTPVALPVFTKEGLEGLSKEGRLTIISDWQMDSVKVSSRKEKPARYDIKAYLTIAPEMPGEYELFPLECLVGKDTLVFANQIMNVKEPSIDMETFQPNDIKPQVKFPLTFWEIAPWVLGILVFAALVYFLVMWLTSRKKREAKPEEPAHIRALRKLDRFRGEKHWKPENQKAFYSGVTDALREYIAARYDVGAMEMTTAEIFTDLKGTDIPADLYLEMKDLFERADFVKFAKHIASDQENATVLPSAVRFVTETYQQDLVKEEV